MGLKAQIGASVGLRILSVVSFYACASVLVGACVCVPDCVCECECVCECVCVPCLCLHVSKQVCSILVQVRAFRFALWSIFHILFAHSLSLSPAASSHVFSNAVSLIGSGKFSLLVLSH